jgi:hypothetical protein
LKFSAIAREITISYQPDTRPPTTTTSNPVAATNDFKLTEDLESLKFKRVELTNWEMALREEQEVYILLYDIFTNCKTLDTERDQMEFAIREEVSKEMEKAFSDMEAEYKRRLQQEVTLLDQKFQSKIDLITRSQKVNILPQDSKKDAEIRRLRLKEEQFSSQLSIYKAEIRSMEQERSDLYAKIAQLEEAASEARMVKDSEVQYWQARLEKEQAQYVQFLVEMTYL